MKSKDIKLRSSYVRERLEVYEKLNRELEVSWDGNWPTFYLWQGQQGLELTLPDVYNILKQYSALKKILRKAVTPANSEQNSEKTSACTNSYNQSGLVIMKPGRENIDLDEFDFEYDVPFVAKK